MVKARKSKLWEKVHPLLVHLEQENIQGQKIAQGGSITIGLTYIGKRGINKTKLYSLVINKTNFNNL